MVVSSALRAAGSMAAAHLAGAAVVVHLASAAVWCPVGRWEMSDGAAVHPVAGFAAHSGSASPDDPAVDSQGTAHRCMDAAYPTGQ